MAFTVPAAAEVAASESSNAWPRHPIELVEIEPADEARIFGGDVPASRQRPRPPGARPMFPVYKSLRSMMSPVKSQGERGTCTAFAAIAVLEAYRPNERFSEQCLAWDCDGQDASNARGRFACAIHKGVNLEQDCPYSNTRSDVPNGHFREAHRRIPSGITQHAHYPAGSGGDPVDFSRLQISHNLPVIAPILVTGY